MIYKEALNAKGGNKNNLVEYICPECGANTISQLRIVKERQTDYRTVLMAHCNKCQKPAHVSSWGIPGSDDLLDKSTRTAARILARHAELRKQINSLEQRFHAELKYGCRHWSGPKKGTPILGDLWCDHPATRGRLCTTHTCPLV